MKKRGAHRVRTGEHCPMTGWWFPSADIQHPMFLSEGTLMPSSKSEPTTWQMIPGSADRTLRPEAAEAVQA